MGLWIFRTGIILDLLTHPKALKSTCWLINMQVVKNVTEEPVNQMVVPS